MNFNLFDFLGAFIRSCGIWILQFGGPFVYGTIYYNLGFESLWGFLIPSLIWFMWLEMWYYR